MLIKQKLLFSREECKSILQTVNTWDDTIISVKLDSTFTKKGGVMKSFNAIFDSNTIWIKDRILNWINQLDGVFEIVALSPPDLEKIGYKSDESLTIRQILNIF